MDGQEKLPLSGKRVDELRQPDRGYCRNYGHVAVQYGSFPEASLSDTLDRELLMRGDRVAADSYARRDEMFKGLLEAAGVENPNPELEEGA